MCGEDNERKNQGLSQGQGELQARWNETGIGLEETITGIGRNTDS